MRNLNVRRQGYNESFVPYMQDILNLCHQADSEMAEEDRMHHLLKQLSEYLFNGIASQAFSIVSECADDWKTFIEDTFAIHLPYRKLEI